MLPPLVASNSSRPSGTLALADVTSEQQFDELYGPYFRLREFQCQGCDEADRLGDCERIQASGERLTWFLKPEFRQFMAKLIILRERLGFPFVVNSGWRCPGWNRTVSSTGLDGPHTMAAADIRVAFERAYDLAEAAFNMGFGVGLKQHGPIPSRFIHLDNLGRRLWTYP